jgi:hypothetical protein
MSTFGRAADRAAAQARRHYRSLEAKRIKLGQVLAFVVATLRDKSIPDHDARAKALQVLLGCEPSEIFETQWSSLLELDMVAIDHELTEISQ